MPFFKRANSDVVNPFSNSERWNNVRVASGDAPTPRKNFIDQASQIFDRKFDPNDFVLTHCTIVASVDVENVNVKTGDFKESGSKLLRRWTDFNITPETIKYINNNNDSFERKVLAKAFPTFIGGHNFQEHVQLEEQSKGRIIDAYGRNIGDSLYIDILVATDKKHTELVRSIQSGDLGTLSMGCKIEHSTCTKCGNVAKDETEMCRHILYEKGNIFHDDKGVKRKIAELCGHHSEDPYGGVEFIEASWVKVPAFTGAVMRNILEAKDASPELISDINNVLENPPEDMSAYRDLFLKAASIIKQADPFEDPESGDKEEPKKKENSKLKDLEDEVYEYLMDKVKNRAESAMDQRKPTGGPDSIAKQNESLLRQAKSFNRKQVYNAGIDSLVRVASTDVDLMNHLALYNNSMGIDLPVALYRTALKLGPTNRYASMESFLAASKRILSRKPSRNEAEILLKLSSLLTKRSEYNR
jgi:hypothetical protein